MNPEQRERYIQGLVSLSTKKEDTSPIEEVKVESTEENRDMSDFPPLTWQFHVLLR